MSFCGRRQQDKEKRNRQDIEGQVTKNDGVDSGEKKTETKAYLIPLEQLIKKWNIDPEGRFIRSWNVMFVVSCVIAVWVDPLFFYLPVINEDKKCLALNKTLRIIALFFRSITDAIYVANMMLQFLCPYIDENARERGQDGVISDAGPIAKRYLSRYFVIDILAILPLPQVLIPIIFSELRGSRFLEKRKVWNAIVLFQYVPRILRIYLSWTQLIATNRKLAEIVWVKAAFNFFLYILASHVLGAFWYLFSIERETACWHIACQNQTGCTRISHDCDQNLRNYAFLNDYCPIQTQNTTLFDFGIFLEALQSGTVASTNVPRKILHCFWWGLRNLSSLGQNLQTSSNFWENFFAVFISIFGLLLFLYFIGNMQTYMQLKTERSEEIIKKLKMTELEIDRWISKHKLDLKIMKRQIIPCIIRALKDNKDVDPLNPFPHLHSSLQRDIKRRICLPLLKKVPLLQNESDDVLKLISSEFLKQVCYNENSYIFREEEPLDALLFITQGIVWSHTASPDHRQTGCLRTNDFYGVELLEWAFKASPDSLLYPSNLPISTRTLRCHTKVQAFALTTGNIQLLLHQHWLKFSKYREITDSNLEQWQSLAASKVQAAFRRRRNARQMTLDESDQKARMQQASRRG